MKAEFSNMLYQGLVFLCVSDLKKKSGRIGVKTVTIFFFGLSGFRIKNYTEIQSCFNVVDVLCIKALNLFFWPMVRSEGRRHISSKCCMKCKQFRYMESDVQTFIGFESK